MFAFFARLKWRLCGNLLGVVAVVLAGISQAYSQINSETGKPLLVFAAASLKDALEPVARDFETETGRAVSLSFAGTSMLARQVAAGAPADIFVSADVDWIAWLQGQGLTVAQDKQIIARNRLALVAPAESQLSSSVKVEDHLLWWLNETDGRLAMADPGHVPAGRYTKAALDHLVDKIGPFEDFKRRLAITENVRLASLLVGRREVPLGIVYWSDAVIDPKIKALGLFPDESHLPITYTAVRTKRGDPQASLFLEFLVSQKALTHFENVGLAAPH